jgi:hypothetical protein
MAIPSLVSPNLTGSTTRGRHRDYANRRVSNWCGTTASARCRSPAFTSCDVFAHRRFHPWIRGGAAILETGTCCAHRVNRGRDAELRPRRRSRSTKLYQSTRRTALCAFSTLSLGNWKCGSRYMADQFRSQVTRQHARRATLNSVRDRESEPLLGPGQTSFARFSEGCQ